MCGRFAVQNLTWAQIVDLARLSVPADALNLEPRYNIAPTQNAAIVRQEGDARTGDTRAGDTRAGDIRAGDIRACVMAQWWLTPHWVREPSFKYAMFNAKLEGIGDKPAFRDPVRSRRCLVPAMNFYEWRGRKGNKTPYYIGRADREPFCFAGVWDRWRGTSGGADTTITSFAIVTTAANALVKPIHARMPVILKPENYDVWLSGEPDAALAAAARPLGPDQMEAFPLGPAIGNVANEGADRADLIAPA